MPWTIGHPAAKNNVRKILEAYRTTVEPPAICRRPDRLLAVELYQRGIPPNKVENALGLAARHRMIWLSDAPPLTTVRSSLLPVRPARTPAAAII